MYTSPWEKAAILVSLLNIAFSRNNVGFHVWVHHGHLLLLTTHAFMISQFMLFTLNKPIFKVFHNSQEFFKTHVTIRIKIELFQEIYGFLWIPVQRLHDCLKVVDVDDLGLILIEHVKDAFEVVYFLF